MKRIAIGVILFLLLSIIVFAITQDTNEQEEKDGKLYDVRTWHTLEKRCTKFSNKVVNLTVFENAQCDETEEIEVMHKDYVYVRDV